MPESAESPVDVRRPALKVDVASFDVARVMVDTSGLASVAEEAAGILTGVLDGLGALVQHDAAGVYVMNPSRSRLRHSMMRGATLPVPDLSAPFAGKGIVGDVMATGKSIGVTDDTSDEVTAGRKSARSRLVVPIAGASGKVLGVIDLWSDLPGGYDQDAVLLLELYGRAVAGAIHSARLQAEMVDKRKLDNEMALARQVMGELLPRTTPTIPGYDIAGTHESSLAVGGDYYEFVPLVDERWGVVVADVVREGHRRGPARLGHPGLDPVAGGARAGPPRRDAPGEPLLSRVGGGGDATSPCSTRCSIRSGGGCCT